jgi:hypothetical protein
MAEKGSPTIVAVMGCGELRQKMQLNYQIPPEKDPKREREPAQWWVLVIAFSFGAALLLAFYFLRSRG